MPHPIKKVKGDHLQSHTKVQDNKSKPSRLTIEEVFNTPSDLRKSCTGGFMADESIDEGSSLSFISSYSSLDNLDEVTPLEESKSHDCPMSNQTTHSSNKTSGSLAINDDIMSHLNNLLSNHLLNPNQPSVFQPSEFLQTLEWEENNFLRNINQSLTIDPINIPLTRLNEYVQTNVEQPEAKLRNAFEFRDEEDCSDFYATRSTSVEQESTNPDAGSDNSQKGASPIYTGNFDISGDERKPESRPCNDKYRGKAVIPVCNHEGSRRARLEPKWNPESVETQELQEYFLRLGRLVGAVTDQESALKLLKSFGMNVSLTLGIVEQNQSFYREMFRVKVKRLRRNGI